MKPAQEETLFFYFVPPEQKNNKRKEKKTCVRQKQLWKQSVRMVMYGRVPPPPQSKVEDQS